MPCLKDMAVELGISAAWVVGDEGKLGLRGPGGGQRDSPQSVSHQEFLHTVAHEKNDFIFNVPDLKQTH